MLVGSAAPNLLNLYLCLCATLYAIDVQIMMKQLIAPLLNVCELGNSDLHHL